MPAQSKFAGHSAGAAQVLGAQRWSAPHAWPTGHAASSVHPAEHALAGEQAHGTGAQINASPWALHSLSVKHVEGGSKHAPQPVGAPGGAHGTTGSVQSS